MGISYSPIQNGAFALLLAVEGDSPIRIPVVIGAAEAQSIAVFLESIRSARPMTHDLFVSFSRAYGIQLKEVFIYKFEDGIYSAEMRFFDGEREVTLDSRTSDAIAVAMRTGAPIYTTPAIVEECGIELQEVKESDGIDADEETLIEGDTEDEAIAETPSVPDDTAIYVQLTEDEENALPDDILEQRLKHFTDTEDYEHAAQTARILKGRNK